MFNANISKNNFLGLGYTMSIAANVSSVQQQGNLQLYDPYFLDSRWTLRVHGYSMARQFLENEYQKGSSLAIGRYLDRKDDLRLEMDYTFEDTGLTFIDSYKQKLLGGQLYRNGLTSTAGLSFVADKRNNRINATQGFYIVASTHLSGGLQINDDELLNLLGGSFNFYEAKLNVRLYQPLVKSQKLIFRYNLTLGQLGSTDGTIIPFIHRYRAGGINSVRGYNWFSLGPSVRALGQTNSSGTSTIFIGSDDPSAGDDRLVVGGTETWINNIEIESPIVPAAGISLVAFLDAGNAFGDPWGEGGISIHQLRLAYGAGVRWMSPMGPLRFEWGVPINPYSNERPYVFDFSMGSFF
jgi:outer membrane protein insertion porin family